MLVIPISRYYKVVYKTDLSHEDSSKTKLVQSNETEAARPKRNQYQGHLD